MQILTRLDKQFDLTDGVQEENSDGCFTRAYIRAAFPRVQRNVKCGRALESVGL